MSCAPYTLIPPPPTTLSSCAVPLGGSNSSILDACCNGHINAITTYSAPDAETNFEDNDGCFQYCVTDSPDMVQNCLAQKLLPYEHDNGVEQSQCFNIGNVGKNGQRSAGGYNSAGVRLSGGSRGMVVVMMMGAVVMGTLVGAI